MEEQQGAWSWRGRDKLLQGSWRASESDGPSIQFTTDGAFIGSDGEVGRYTPGPEEQKQRSRFPCQVEASSLTILSLTGDQLVLEEAKEAKVYLKHAPPNTESQKMTPLHTLLEKLSSWQQVSPHVAKANQELPSSAAQAPLQRMYLDCPNCGKGVYVDQVDPDERIDCTNCGGRFLVKDAINLRNAPQRVEKNGFFKRLLVGSSINLSNMEDLEWRVRAYSARVNSEMAQGNYQAAQVWQLKLNEVMRQLDNL